MQYAPTLSCRIAVCAEARRSLGRIASALAPAPRRSIQRPYGIGPNRLRQHPGDVGGDRNAGRGDGGNVHSAEHCQHAKTLTHRPANGDFIGHGVTNSGPGHRLSNPYRRTGACSYDIRTANANACRGNRHGEAGSAHGVAYRYPSPGGYGASRHARASDPPQARLASLAAAWVWAQGAAPHPGAPP